MAKDKAVLTLVTYKARPGSEEQLRGVLRTHVARLRELGLVADKPWFVARKKDEPGTVVEQFWWLSEGAAAQARDNGEVQELWMRVEDLCAEGGIQHTQLVPLD
jgi:hypothetical protein